MEMGLRLDTGLKDLPKYKGSIVRGIDINSVDELRGFDKNTMTYQEGMLASYSYNTTSTNDFLAEPFVLRVKDNVSGVSISQVSQIPDEFEILVPSTTRYKVVSGPIDRHLLNPTDPLYLDTPGQGYVIEMEEITQNG